MRVLLKTYIFNNVSQFLETESLASQISFNYYKRYIRKKKASTKISNNTQFCCNYNPTQKIHRHKIKGISDSKLYIFILGTLHIFYSIMYDDNIYYILFSISSFLCRIKWTRIYMNRHFILIIHIYLFFLLICDQNIFISIQICSILPILYRK